MEELFEMIDARLEVLRKRRIEDIKRFLETKICSYERELNNNSRRDFFIGRIACVDSEDIYDDIKEIIKIDKEKANYKLELDLYKALQKEIFGEEA